MEGSYCLLCAAFSALNALRYCDSNIPIMDKIFFLVKQADGVLLDLQLLLDDQDLFGSMRGVILSDCKLELDEDLEKQIWKGMISYKGESVSFFVDFILKQATIFGYFSAKMMIMMTSLLEMQYYLYGKPGKGVRASICSDIMGTSST